MSDKRRFPRIRFGFRVEEKKGKQTWMTDDISPGGCFLHALEEVPIGSKINLVFQLPGSAKYIEAVGEVKHVHEKGLGIEFVTMDDDSKEQTGRFVKEYVKYQDMEQPEKPGAPGHKKKMMPDD